MNPHFSTPSGSPCRHGPAKRNKGDIGRPVCSTSASPWVAKVSRKSSGKIGNLCLYILYGAAKRRDIFKPKIDVKDCDGASTGGIVNSDTPYQLAATTRQSHLGRQFSPRSPLKDRKDEHRTMKLGQNAICVHLFSRTWRSK